MRILAVSHSCVLDANQHVLNELVALGHDLTVVVPATWRHEYSQDQVKPRKLPGFGGKIFPLAVAKAGSVPLHWYWRVPKTLIDEARPDVLYCEEEPYSLSAFQWSRVATRSKVPFVFSSLQNIPKRYPLPIRMLERSVWRRAAGAVAITDSVARTLRDRGYPGPVHIVPLSVDTSAFKPGARDEQLRASMNLRSLVVAYAGRFVPEKGIETLLSASSILSDRLELSVLLIGGGTLPVRSVGSPHTVVASGVSHRDMPRYLRLADVLVLPSKTTPRWKEQFGRVIIEALACGVPVVGSDSGEIPNIIHSTGGGAVFREGSVRELAALILALLTDRERRQRLASAGMLTVRDRFSSHSIALSLQEALSVYASTCSPSLHQEVNPKRR